MSLLCTHLSILRPSHWWRSTPSSKITSMCLMPSGWQKMTALRRHKKVSLHHQQGFTFTLSQAIWDAPVYTFTNVFFKCMFPGLFHSQRLHMEVINPGQLSKQTCFITSLRFSEFIVKHDPLCWSRAEQS